MAEKTFNAGTLKTDPMLATRALVLQARITKLLGPAMARFGDVMQGFGENKSEEQKTKATAAALTALVEVFAAADPEGVAVLLSDIVNLAMIRRADGKYYTADLDGDFTQNKGEIFPVVLWILREQFGDFFSELPGNGNLGNLLKG